MLQTNIDYNSDTPRAKREITITGMYSSRPAAVKVAKKTPLVDDVMTSKSLSTGLRFWDKRIRAARMSLCMLLLRMDGFMR